MVRNNQSVNPSIREALQATFAKPGVLPLISFGSPPTNYMEWMYTNPSSLIDSECRQLSCRDDLTLVLNIGIDRDLITQSQEFPGEHSSHINEKLLQDSARIAEEARKTFGPKTFLRISVRTGAHDATGPVRSSAIVAHAFSYLSRDAKSELLDEIVTRLFPEENHKRKFIAYSYCCLINSFYQQSKRTNGLRFRTGYQAFLSTNNISRTPKEYFQAAAHGS